MKDLAGTGPVIADDLAHVNSDAAGSVVADHRAPGFGCGRRPFGPVTMQRTWFALVSAARVTRK